MNRSPKPAGQHQEVEKSRSPKRPYQRPDIKVLDESEVLATFQITSAFASWWL